MKQNDIAMLLVIGFVSAVLSFFASGVLFNTSEDKQLTSQVVVPISAEFPTPSNEYFNSNSIDPTQIIRIGEGSNTQPLE